jgi:putative endonuclease
VVRLFSFRSNGAASGPNLPSVERETTKARGDRAESIVVLWLEQNGFVVLERNLRLGHLEIDIVAREGRVVAVVEVRSRSRSSRTSGFSSFSSEKKLRVRRAGERLWNRRFKRDPSVDRLRYDAASVCWEDGRAIVEYARAAF